MKRIYVVLMMVCILFVAIAGITSVTMTAFAEPQSEVIVKNTAFYPIPDEEFTTTLYVDENSTVAALNLSISYNADYITLISTEDIQATVTNYDESAHAIRIAYANTQNATARVDLVSLTFKVNKNLAAGAYPDWLVWMGQDEDEAYTINTRSAYDALPIHIAIDELFVRQKGDAYNNNNDGKINALDALHCLRHSVGDIVMSDIDIYYANVYTDNENGNPVINARDAVKILKYSVKMDVELDNRANVSFYDIDAYGNYYLAGTKSVVKGNALETIPAILAHDGYEDGIWSLSATGLQEPDFSNIVDDLSVYARYTYTGRTAEGFNTYYKVIRALDEGFFQAGKYIVNNFQLPNKNAYGSFNMLTSPEFDKVDIIWNSDSKRLAQGISILDNYTVYVPNIDYTTWVTFSANIYIDGIKYGTVDYDREIKGTIDLPDDSTLQRIVDDVPSAFAAEGETYRLPGYVSLATGRMQYGVEMVQDVDIKWTIDEEHAKSFDSKRYAFVYLQDEKTVEMKAQFSIDGKVFKTSRLSLTIPALSWEEQKEYAKEYLSAYVPSILSGVYLFPTSIDRLDFNVIWRSDSAMGKINTDLERYSFADAIYQQIGVGAQAGYMEPGYLVARVERGDDAFELTYLVKLAGESDEVSLPYGIADENLYNALLPIFGVDDGLGGKKLTEQSLADASALEKNNYTLDLSNMGIANIKGLEYVTGIKRLVLSGNDLSGSNANLVRLASLTNLEQLVLSNCNLHNSNLSSAIFADMYKIEGVDLSYNNLTNLSFLRFSDINPRQMTSLTDLFVQGNDLIDVSALAFTNDKGVTVSRIPKVKRLTLSRKADSTYNESLDIRPIGYASELSVLWLSNHNISDISALANCKLLTVLDLSKNDITATVQQNGLAPLRNLVSLNTLLLNDNDIVVANELRKLVQLQYLSLANNHITSLSTYLNKMSGLEYLDLDNNQLSSLNLGYFDNLRYCYAENNRLTQIVNLSKATGLVELRLNNNVLERTTIDNIGELTDLTYLSLSNNTVGDLAFLENLTELRHLELASSNLNQIYLEEEQQLVEEDGVSIQKTVQVERDNIARLYALSKLTVLDLSNNNNVVDISGLTDGKGGLTNLRTFYLDNVAVTDASAIRKMGQLTNLSMQNNGAASLAFVQYLDSLTYANLSGHKASMIDYEMFGDKIDLQYLFTDSAINTTLSGNLEALGNIPALRYLSLRNVCIGSIDYIPELEAIEYLDLANTKITDFVGQVDENGIRAHDLKYDVNLKWLDVSGNDYVFMRSNLNALYDLHKNAPFYGQLSVWLYSDRNIVGFDNDREAETIHSFLTGIPQTTATDRRQIHTFYNGSDFEGYGDYALQSVLRGYELTWTLEDENFVVENNVLSVADWRLYADSNLLLRTAIDVYDNDGKEANELTDYVYVASSPYTVTKYAKAGTKDSTETKYFNVAVGEMSATREGFDLAGWYIKRTGFAEDITADYRNVTIDSNRVVPDLTVYARWNYTVNYDGNGATPSFARKQYAEGEPIVIPTVSKDNYDLAGWYSGEQYIDSDYVSANGAITLKAKWVTAGNGCIINKYDGETVVGQSYAERNTTIDASWLKKAKEGYYLVGWYLDSELTQPIDTLQLTEQTVNIYGKWREKEVSYITYDANGGDGTMVDSSSKNAYLFANAFVRNGYNFIGWSLTSDGEPEYSDLCETAEVLSEDEVRNVTLYAVWENQAAYALSDDGTYYKATGINSCPDGNLYILSTYNGKPVKEVVMHAFKDCTTLKTVVVENGITIIGEEAFSGCINLESISVPFVGTSATATGKDSLFGAIFDKSEKGDGYNRAYTQDINISNLSTWEYWLPNKLKTVAITDGTSLPYGALIRCTYVETVTLPDTLKTVSYDAFWGCSGLKNVYIPEGVTTIGEKAFENCSALTEIVVPSTVTLIENKAFAGCSSLKTITLPFAGRALSATNNYEKVFGYIFGYTKGSESTNSSDVSKKNVSYYTKRSETVDNKTVYYYTPYTYNIPASLKTVIFNGTGAMGVDGSSSRSAFRYCTTIEKVVIGGNISTIPSYAFYYSTGLKTVAFGESVTTVKDYAFAYCSSLTSITFGENITTIGEAAFGGCSNLTNVQLNQGLRSIGKDAFGATPVLDTIVIPSSVTTIGATAFGDGEAFNWNQHLTIYCESGSAGANWDSTWNKDKSGSLTANKTIATIYGVSIDWSTVQYDRVFKGWVAVNSNGNVITPSASTDWTKVKFVATYE